MTHGLTTDYAKNYCNRTLIVKVIVIDAIVFSVIKPAQFRGL